MSDHHIDPHKVTKPIQLLAAWLVGLIVTNAIFLASAINLDKDGWKSGALVAAAIINVPVFLFALFILQTRFRAELQEDTYYSEYLSKKSATVVRVDKNAAQDTRLDALERQLLRLTTHFQIPSAVSPDSERKDYIDWSNWPIALNSLHPRFTEIREALRAAKIPLASIFDGHGELPKEWIVALSYHLPILHKAKLLEVILPFGFDGISFWEPVREAEENEDVYIGSYGNNAYARVTPELLDLVRTNIEPVDLEYYYDRHKRQGSAST